MPALSTIQNPDWQNFPIFGHFAQEKILYQNDMLVGRPACLFIIRLYPIPLYGFSTGIRISLWLQELTADLVSLLHVLSKVQT